MMTVSSAGARAQKKQTKNFTSNYEKKRILFSSVHWMYREESRTKAALTGDWSMHSEGKMNPLV